MLIINYRSLQSTCVYGVHWVDGSKHEPTSNQGHLINFVNKALILNVRGSLIYYCGIFWCFTLISYTIIILDCIWQLPLQKGSVTNSFWLSLAYVTVNLFIIIYVSASELDADSHPSSMSDAGLLQCTLSFQ